MAMGDMEDMDMDVNAAMLMLNQKLMLTTDMVDTEDMVDMDMAVNDDLLSLIMDMEATEDMDTDMDVKLLLVNSEENQLNPATKDKSNEDFSSTPNNPFISKNKIKEGDFLSVS